MLPRCSHSLILTKPFTNHLLCAKGWNAMKRRRPRMNQRSSLFQTYSVFWLRKAAYIILPKRMTMEVATDVGHSKNRELLAERTEKPLWKCSLGVRSQDLEEWSDFDHLKNIKKLRVRRSWSRVARTQDACWGRVRQRVVRRDASGSRESSGKSAPYCAGSEAIRTVLRSPGWRRGLSCLPRMPKNMFGEELPAGKELK